MRFSKEIRNLKNELKNKKKEQENNKTKIEDINRQIEEEKEKRRKVLSWWLFWGFFVVMIAAMILIAIGTNQLPKFTIYGWGIDLILMIILFMLLGNAVNQKWYGILIDERNKVSLSRIQMILWSILILGSYVFMALYTSFHNESITAIHMDSGLFALLGISTVSLVGSPFIKALKSDEEIEEIKGKAEKIEKKNAKKVNVSTEFEDTHNGLIKVNPDESYARFSDIFYGEELLNFTKIDLVKVQQFLFTVIAILVYTVEIYSTIINKQFIYMPYIPEGLIIVIAISHGGYLLGKGLKKS